jgi:hypothetical protein
MTTSIRKALLEEKRQKYISGLINEAIVQILSEQDAAAAPMGMPAPAAPPADVSAPPSPEAPAPSQPKEFTVDDMIERLNVIRGGRSFTDPEVYGQLVSFFKKQNDDQKAQIEQFLVEIGKIVINVNEQEAPQQAETSAAPPATPPPATEAPPVPPTPAAPPPA